VGARGGSLLEGRSGAWQAIPAILIRIINNKFRVSKPCDNISGMLAPLIVLVVTELIFVASAPDCTAASVISGYLGIQQTLAGLQLSSCVDRTSYHAIQTDKGYRL